MNTSVKRQNICFTFFIIIILAFFLVSANSAAAQPLKKVMEKAGIEGPQATPKGFRHGFGVAMVIGGMDLYTLQHILGHERPETTAIYLQVKGQEAHELQMQYWKNANKNWKR